MKRIWYKPLIIFILTCSLFTCTEPYGLKFGRFHSLLVVEAMLTDAVGSNYVRSSGTITTVNGIKDINFPLFKYTCNRIVMGVDDYPPSLTPSDIMTFYKIYYQYTGSGYEFIEPIYGVERKLSGLALSAPACSDCTLQGGLIKPSFWIDL